MKKFLCITGIIVTFFISYFIQVNFFSWFNIAGVKPNLFIILVLFVGLFIDKKLSAIIGLVLGMYLDILVCKQVGISAILYAIIGYTCGFLDNSFSKESKITIILIVAASTFLYELFLYMYTLAINKLEIQFLGFIKICAIEVLFNSLLTIVIYPVIRHFADVAEGTFKKNKQLLRLM